MLIDRPQVLEGSVIVNATVPSGTSFPSSPNIGELFFRSDLGSLQTYTGSAWVEAGAVSLASHIADQALHLTSAQNTVLDGLASTLTAIELNYVDGVTSPIQTQLDAASGSFTSHINDDSRHLTAAENTLIDGITVTSTEINYLTGANAPVQSQINTINALDTAQNGRLTTLENTTVPAVQTNLTNHMADDLRHITAVQNTLLDAITVTAADINKLSGAAGLTSSVKLSLDQLAGSDYSTKISANGTIGMSGNLSLGGNRITGLAMPIASTDAASKDYVDSFVQGLHWVGSVQAASIGNLVLSGFQTVDGVALTNSDRVLVKDQNTSADNGIYLVASGAWSRANDFNIALEINNSAVFVLAGGTTQGKSTWVQTASVTTLGTDPISFSAFSGPVVNQAGGGITLGVNGIVSVKEGAGLAFDGNNALIVDVFAGGGLMITTNNTTAATLTTTGAQLALTQSGVTAGSYGSATQAPTFTVDSKGRLTIASMTTITPAFGSITGLPTTIAGYGITNAVLKTGDVMSGNLTISPATGSGTVAVFRSSAAAGQASLNLVTSSGAGAGTWQLYNQTGLSNFSIYSSIFGSDIMSMTTAGNTVFAGSVQATNFIGPLSGNAASATYAISAGTVTSITSGQVTSALGFTPYNATNPAGYISSISYGQVVGALGYTPYNATNPAGYITSVVGSLGYTPYNAANPAGYISSISGAQVTSALGYTPYNGSTNPNGYITSVVGSLGYTPYNAANPAGYISSISYGQVIGALGFTPYNSSNPAGYISSISGGQVISALGYTPYNGSTNPNGYLVGSNLSNYIQRTTDSWQVSSEGRNRFYFVTNGMTIYSGEGHTWYSQNGTSLGQIDLSGNLVMTGNVTAYSDRRLKTDIKTIPNALEKVEALTGITFNRIDNGQAGTGLIAQDVQSVLPEAVLEDNDGMLSVAYGNIAGLFVEAIKELNREMAELRAELKALKESK